MLDLKKILVTACLLSLVSLNVSAKDQQDNFESGKKSFNQGQYEQALTYFNKALEQDKDSPKLYYSLGSVHYKLKNYQTSKKYFLRLTKDQQFGPLAYYNLGLITHKTKDDELAIRYFRKSRSVTRSKSLKKLNSKQISKLRKTTKKPWSAYVSAGYGYDSNITSAPDGVASNQSGSFVRATALADYIVTGTRTEGIVTKATIFANDYLATNFNDDESLALDISLRNKQNGWKLNYDAGIKQSTYGGENYQRIYRLTFKARSKIVDNNELRFRYRYEDINSLSPQFDFLDGTRQRLRTEYRIKRPSDRLRLRYELELNDRQNTNNTLTPATRNFSPTRHKFVIKYDNKLDLASTISGEVEYRTSDYEQIPTQDRSDDRFSAAIGYAYSFDNSWKLKARVKYKNNDSNEPGDIFDYDRTITTIDMSRRF